MLSASTHRRIASVAACVFAASAATAVAGSTGTGARNGRLAYTVVSSALQIYAQSPEDELARRVVTSNSVDYEPVQSPDGTRIAFVSERDGNPEIYVADANGANAKRITAHPAFDWDPAWAPDSQRIAFASGRAGNSELYVVRVDGRDPTRLTTSATDEENPSWSPDGARITYWAEDGNDSEVYAMNADGSGAVQLTDNRDEDFFPAWSPDGSSIAFTSDRGSQGDAEIFVMNTDGTGVRQLTVTSGSIDDWWPAWSPDGGRIAFVSDRGDDDDIYVIGADGRGLVTVTDAEGHDFNPSWTRDGRILYATERAANLGIESARLDGADRRLIARTPLEESSPEWSPDGTRIAYVGGDGERSDIWVASDSGGRRKRLTHDPRFADSDPSWSPDGRNIAFAREDEFGISYLFVMRADGSRPRFLLESYELCCVDWSPDGRWLAVSTGNGIVLVDQTGKSRRTVTIRGTSPSWSPDGRWIAFSSDRDDDADLDIFVVSSRGGPATQLTDNYDDDDWPAWSPDGRLIAFARGDLDDLESSIYVMRPDGTQQRRVALDAPASQPSWQPVP